MLAMEDGIFQLRGQFRGQVTSGGHLTGLVLTAVNIDSLTGYGHNLASRVGEHLQGHYISVEEPGEL